MRAADLLFELLPGFIVLSFAGCWLHLRIQSIRHVDAIAGRQLIVCLSLAVLRDSFPINLHGEFGFIWILRCRATQMRLEETGAEP